MSSRAARRRAAGLGRSSTNRAADRARHGLEARLERLALPVGAEQLSRGVPAAALLSFGAAFLLLGPAGPVTLALALFLAALLLHRSAPRRRAGAAERALPAVLDGVARQLRAGGSLAQAIAAVRPPATAPDLQRSWARLTDLIPILGVAAALDEWASAPPSATPDGRATPVRGPKTTRGLDLAAAALSLAAATGGSPARAIDGVAATLRSRLAVADEIRALSSQARASAAVIALAPILFGVLAAAGDRRTRDFLASPSGLVLVAAGLTLDALGAWWMARLCRPAAGSS